MSTNSPAVEPERPQTDPERRQTAPPAAGRATPPPARDRRLGRLLPGLILVALGLVFLAGNLGYITWGGGALFLGLAAAFLIARLLTGNYGLAVPAGVLAGFGAYVTLEERGLLPDAGGGWFFILLGLGFVAVYLIGLRPAAIWPFFPAAGLIAFGALVEGLVTTGPLASLAWIANYWPLVLVLVGLWLLVRDRAPASIRGPLALLGGLALALYGIVAIASTIAATSGPYAGPWPRIQIGLPGLGGTLYRETRTLNAPLGAGDTLRIVTTSGRTVVRAGGGAGVQVTATTHYSTPGQIPAVRLTPGNGGLTLEQEAAGQSIFGRAYTDYVVEAPASAAVTVQSASGDVEMSGLAGAVQVTTASGAATLTDLTGPVTIRTISGDQRLTGLTGEVRTSSTSGDIQASGLAHPREATSVSGNVRLAGAFVDSATIRTTSGDVRLQFAPTSSARIDVTTTSGDIRTQGLTLADQRQSSRGLTGALGAGAGALTVSTISGDVTLAGT